MSIPPLSSPDPLTLHSLLWSLDPTQPIELIDIMSGQSLLYGTFSDSEIFLEPYLNSKIIQMNILSTPCKSLLQLTIEFEKMPTSTRFKIATLRHKEGPMENWTGNPRLGRRMAIKGLIFNSDGKKYKIVTTSKSNE